MERVYAFCYAVGDARHIGEIKIGEMGALSFQEARRLVTARYRLCYGRALRLYKLIPVAVPKRTAEGCIKEALRPYHACGELYDLPPEMATTCRILDEVYNQLAVSMEHAYFVVRTETSDTRRQRLKQERSAVYQREVQRLQRKRDRIDDQEERAMDALATQETKEANRAWKETLDTIERRRLAAARQHESKTKRERELASINVWASTHIKEDPGGLYTLKVAYASYLHTGMRIGKIIFSRHLQGMFPNCFHEKHKNMNSVFTGLRLIELS